MSKQFNIGMQPKFYPPRRSFTEIDRDELVRQTLDEAIGRLADLGGNYTYQRAFEIAARVLKAMKP